MRSRGVVMLVVAMLAGLMAMFLAARWMSSQGVRTDRVVVAAVEVPLGTVLSADMLKSVDWPQGNLPAGAIADVTKLNGRVINTSLQPGEPVLESRLAPEGTRGGMASMVAPGKRAMAVRVNDVLGVSGFALPGSYVDVLVSTQAGAAGREGAISKIVLERMLILAVNQEIDRDNTKPKTVNAVTLEVTPQQAEILDLARTVGTLSLVLRNQTEATAGGTEGATKDELLGLVRQVAAVPAPAPIMVQRLLTAKSPAAGVVAVAATEAVVPRPQECVDVIRGVTKTTECF